MFIIRSIFWLSIVLLLIPGPSGKDGPSVGAVAVDALLAARGVAVDLSGICSRQPDVCTHGGAALETFGARAWQGATTLVTRFGSSEPASAVAPAAGTLMPGDVEPSWRTTSNGAGKA